MTSRWAPGTLTGVDDLALATKNPDIWWTDGEGLVLSDGVSINGGISGQGWSIPVVVNLRGEHKPKLSLDRSKVVEWNPLWLVGALEEIWPNVVSWQHFSLGLLCRLWPVPDQSLPKSPVNCGAAIPS